MHTIESALQLIREIEPILAANGYHCGLTGSVLFKGQSEKDCDIIIYPHSEDRSLWKTPSAVLKLLEKVLEVDSDYTDPEYKRPIAITMFKGARVDLFFFSSFDRSFDCQTIPTTS